jgi:hypothetical protein
VLDLSELLALSPSESRGLLMGLARAQVARRSPRDVLAQWSRDATVRPSSVDLRMTVRFDALALEAAVGYDALLLSPVAPLGVNAVVAPTSEDRTLATTRGSEVVSDPTNVLAVESARRLVLDPEAEVRLCTSHQILRMQQAPTTKGRSQHFRLFALSDAGRGRPDHDFEVSAVLRQIGVYSKLLDSCEPLGLTFPDRAVILRASVDRQVLGDRIAEALASSHPALRVHREPLVSVYYGGLRVGFGAVDRAGEFQEIVDLGAFDWVAQYVNDARQRFVASAIGIQLLALLF